VMAFGFEVEDVVPILSRLGDVGIATGADMGRLILALGQVRTTGRLMGQELRQFTNAGVPILEYLAKVLNTTSAEIPNLVRQGRISFADVAGAINMMTDAGGLFHGMMQRINKETVSGRWANFKESLQLTGMALGEAFFETFRFKEVLTSLTDNLRGVKQSEASEFFIGFRLALVAAWDTIKTIVTVIGEWINRNRTLVAYILAVIAVMKILSAVVFLVSTAWATLTAALYFFTSPIGIIAIALVGLIALLEQLGAFEGMGDRIAKGFSEIAPMFTEAWKGVVDAVKGNDLELAFGIITTAIHGAWQFTLGLMEIEWEKFKNKLLNNVGGGALDFIEKAKVKLNTFSVIGDLGIALPGFATPAEADKMMAQRFQRLQMIDKRAAMLEAANNAETDATTKAIYQNALKDLSRAKEDLQKQVNFAKVRALFPVGTRGGDILSAGQVVPPGPTGALSAITGIAATGGAFQDLYVRALMRLNAVRGPLEAGAKVEDIPKIIAATKEAVKELEEFERAMRGVGETTAKITKPIKVSTEALHAAQELQKEFSMGTDSLEKFSIQVSRLREAAEGPFRDSPIFQAVIGPAGLMANPGSVISGDQLNFGLRKAFQQLHQETGNIGEKFAPAFAKGSREAQEVITRSNAQMLSVEDQVLQTLRFSAELHAQQVAYTKQVAAAITNNKEAAGLAKGLGIGP